MYKRYSEILLRTLVLSVMSTLFVACNQAEQGDKTGQEEERVNQTEDNLSDEIDQSYFEIADVPLFSYRDSNSGLYGYINLDGEVIIPPQFDQAFDFVEGFGLVTVVIDGMISSGFIDEKGEYIIGPRFVEASEFSEGLAAVSTDQMIGYINKQGEIVLSFNIDQFDRVFPFSEGMAMVGKWGSEDDWYMSKGFINRDGDVVIEPQFRSAADFSAGLSLVSDGEKGFLIDKQGTIINEGPRDRMCLYSEGIACEKDENERWGFINLSGEIVIDHQFERVGEFSQGLAPVKLNSLLGFINMDGEMVIEPRYEMASSFSEGLAWVSVDEKWGAIDRNGNIVIEEYYEFADSFNGGLARVFNEGKEQFVNQKGEVVFIAE
ncbi:WG repeat-containing protein [Halalkalibacter okhensis]|uniref:WG repeat-containing protein n=1 Tax=Halalkalibacter okhensis TaxID=333138 RepID=A0A0B0I9G5_9BACI|nr:WG repeat-containing protein [Halalkalibacter okhensis]KHF37890.1 hypothetical protein LQ50_24580 [Halalkalibacter okhensis]